MSLPENRRALFFISWILFLVSFFFPAYETYRGWACAQFCLQMLWSVLTGKESLGVIYYGCFTFTNAGMLISPLLVLRKNVSRRLFITTAVLAVLMVLHIISFRVIAHNDTFHPGYYLWLSSFVVFGCEWIRVGARRHIFAEKIKDAAVAG